MQCNRRIYSLDIIKIFATICILFHHYQQLMELRFATGINFYYGWESFGYLVELFFEISGFLAYMSIVKVKDAKELNTIKWIERRYIRLMPLVILSTIIFETVDLLSIYILGSPISGINPSLWGTILTSIGIQSGWFFENPMINNPVWYISCLLLCYIILALLNKLSMSRGWSILVLFSGMIILGCIGLNYELNYPFFNGASSRAYCSFFMGG